jgi:hypothetical protein
MFGSNGYLFGFLALPLGTLGILCLSDRLIDAFAKHPPRWGLSLGTNFAGALAGALTLWLPGGMILFPVVLVVVSSVLIARRRSIRIRYALALKTLSLLVALLATVALPMLLTVVMRAIIDR